MRVCGLVLGALASCAGAEPGADSRGAKPPMDFTISIPPEVRQGDPVPVTLRLRNTSPRPLTVYLQGRPTAFDIEVTNQAGRVVWRRLAGEPVQAILGVQTLAPGASLTFEDAWPQRDQAGRSIPPGHYTLVGRLLTDGDSLTTRPTTVRVRPGR